MAVTAIHIRWSLLVWTRCSPKYIFESVHEGTQPSYGSEDNKSSRTRQEPLRCHDV